MIRQSKTTIKELSAQYRSVLKRAFLAGVVALTTVSANAEVSDADMATIASSMNVAPVTEPAPVASTYTYKLPDGTDANLSATTTAETYANYVADSAADGETVKLADDKFVKLGETMAAASYQYLAKNAEGEDTWLAGTVDVADLNKTYVSTYGSIDVSTAAEPVVDIANYTDGDYSLHVNTETGEIELYQNGALELDSPNMLATLKNAYEADVAGVAALKDTLDGYKAVNEANHDAIAGIVTADNETIASIDANKTTWTNASANFDADTDAYNNAVAAYDNSLSKLVNDKIASNSVNAIAANATMSEVTEPAPTEADYSFTKADGTTATLADNVVAADFDNYVADSAANGETVKLADGASVKLGETMDAASYQYLAKNAEGDADWVAGDTAVAELTKTHTTAYGAILTVSSDSAAPDLDVSQYVNGDYALHQETDGSIVLYQNGALEQDSPNMYDTLMAQYNADKNAIESIKGQLDEYKVYNTTNHDAIAGVVEADNATITSIDANKTTWTNATADFNADTVAYNNAVAAYDNSVSKVINTKVADATSMGANAGANYVANASVVDAVKSIDTNMGTIHGLIESADATQTSTGVAYNGNLAVGTTVEDHLEALDTAIGDRRNLSGDYVSNADVATNLQSLNDGIEAEVQRATNAEGVLQTAINDETTRATNAENALQAAIDNINTASVAAVNALDDRVSANTQAISGLNNKVDSLEKNVSGGVAAATALSAVEVSNVKKGEMSVGGGYGYYNSQSAMALGAAVGLSDNWSVNAGAGIASGDKTQVSFRAGTNYKFKLF